MAVAEIEVRKIKASEVFGIAEVEYPFAGNPFRQK
jgi:hypothetical protein